MKHILILLLAATSLLAQWQMTPVKDGAYLYNTETGRTFICKSKNRVMMGNDYGELERETCMPVKFHHNYLNKNNEVDHTQSMLPIKADR